MCCGDQCYRSGYEMERAVRPELDVKSFRQNVLCSEFIMRCFHGTDVCCSSCVCVCVHVCKRVMLQTSTKMHGLRSEVVEKHDRFLS